MPKLIGLLLLLMVASCAHFNNSENKSEDLDGIIFLDENEDEKSVKTSASAHQSNGDEQVNKKQENPEDVRNFKEMEGIILLNFEDQSDEIPEKPLKPNHNKLETGKASYYAMKFKGRKTASGEIYDPVKLTAAHPTLPFGTKVRVTNLYTQQSVIVRINDRGPQIKSRIIDLSYAAAEKLGIISKGIADVAIELIE